ncbi:hypothetical protein WUBG_00744 [Wuchereria bancrofti]|uniref:Uncharacterized protein n=1 Tax=Wuchereria bancrofti TaxID=6293 RepID=J9FFC4_WUCBA|nr:hypothetical protein WUBG_00744 [Wuchereria bancrofti]
MTTQAKHSAPCVTQKETRSTHLMLGASIGNGQERAAAAAATATTTTITTAVAGIDMKVVVVAELSMAPSTKCKPSMAKTRVLLAPLAPPPSSSSSSSSAAAAAVVAVATAAAEAALFGAPTKGQKVHLSFSKTISALDNDVCEGTLVSDRWRLSDAPQ